MVYPALDLTAGVNSASPESSEFRYHLGVTDDRRPDATEQFIEEVAAFMALRGLPRMAGRLFAWLLVAEPPEQTAAQLAAALRASPGAVSTMSRLLISLNLVQRLRRPGERADRFWIPPEAMSSVLTSQLEAVRGARQLFDRGLAAMSDRPASARERIREMRDMWAFWEEELPAITERWRQRRKESTQA